MYEALAKPRKMQPIPIYLDENIKYDKEKEAIYNAKYATEEKRNKALEKLEEEHQAAILRIQEAGLLAQLKILESEHNAGLISDEDYAKKSEDIHSALATTQAQISKLNLDIQIHSWDDFLKSFKKIAENLEVVNQAIIQPLLDLQDQRIENEKKLTDEQLDQQKQRLLDEATSQEEKDAIEEKFKKKQATADAKYAEEKRKLALKQLAISSALAAMQVLATSTNLYTRIAGLALVAAEYAINRKKIMEQQFEKGGGLKKTLNNGGVFSGNSHKQGGIKFLFGGNPVETEGNEGYVINKKSMGSQRQMTVTGTPSQVASAANVAGGGIDFAPGARKMMFEYGGSLGTNLTAPVYPTPTYFANATMGRDDLSELKEMYIANMRAIEAVSSQVLNLQVSLDPNKVTNYQTKRNKAVKLGTL